jgi:hypothetical protein
MEADGQAVRLLVQRVKYEHRRETVGQTDFKNSTDRTAPHQRTEAVTFLHRDAAMNVGRQLPVGLLNASALEN